MPDSLPQIQTLLADWLHAIDEALSASAAGARGQLSAGGAGAAAAAAGGLRPAAGGALANEALGRRRRVGAAAPAGGSLASRWRGAPWPWPSSSTRIARAPTPLGSAPSSWPPTSRTCARACSAPTCPPAASPLRTPPQSRWPRIQLADAQRGLFGGALPTRRALATRGSRLSRR